MIRSLAVGGGASEEARVFECSAARVVQVVGGMAERGQRAAVSAQQVIMAQVGGGTTMALLGLAWARHPHSSTRRSYPNGIARRQNCPGQGTGAFITASWANRSSH